MEHAIKQVKNQLKILNVGEDGALQVPTLELGPKSGSSINKARLYAQQSGPMATHAAGSVSPADPPPLLPGSAANSPGKVYQRMSLTKAGHSSVNTKVLSPYCDFGILVDHNATPDS